MNSKTGVSPEGREPESGSSVLWTTRSGKSEVITTLKGEQKFPINRWFWHLKKCNLPAKSLIQIGWVEVPWRTWCTHRTSLIQTHLRRLAREAPGHPPTTKIPQLIKKQTESNSAPTEHFRFNFAITAAKMEIDRWNKCFDDEDMMNNDAWALSPSYIILALLSPHHMYPHNCNISITDVFPLQHLLIDCIKTPKYTFF